MDDSTTNEHSETPAGPLILLTGASGYVGGRLLERLQSAGRRVRCLARQPERLAGRARPRTELVAGDLLNAASLGAALAGADTAYFLVHSLGRSDGFEELDRRAADNFARAAHAAGLRRIVYLGGLGDPDKRLAPLLRSRHEVGQILRNSGSEVIEFRASAVIGSGSFSFEMVRALVERQPVLVAPRWTSVQTQPIAVTDLLAYLTAALELPAGPSRIFEIGGADRVSYRRLMRLYARRRGLRRLILPAPLRWPRLSSMWLALITPLHARAARKVIDSLRHPTVVRDEAALEAFDIRPRGAAEAIDEALANEDCQFAETRWSDALSSSDHGRSWAGVRLGNRLIDSRAVRVAAPPADAFRPIERIGGATGWYYANWLWRLRGLMDQMVGGVGLRRGRRDPERLAVGDTLDCWRVEALEPDRRLRLAAEMKMPGRAWLQFDVEPDGDGATIRQTAILEPAGLGGLLYWYALYPIHQRIFTGMLAQIAGRAVTAPST